MGRQSCQPHYREFVGLFTTGQCDILKISRLSEKVRNYLKGLQGTEDKSLDEEKKKQKEPKGQNNGDGCLDSTRHAAYLKELKTADRKLLNEERVEKCEKKELGEGHTDANNSLPPTEPVEPKDGAKLSDVDECLDATDAIKDLCTRAVGLAVFISTCCGILFKSLFWYLTFEDTSQIEQRGNQNHPPLKRSKLGDKSYILKNVSVNVDGTGYSPPLKVLSNSILFTWLLGIAVLVSQFPGTTAARVYTESSLTTGPAMEADLPYACTDDGSQPDDTWLDRNEVKAMTSGSVFNGSDKGYTDICPNAFHGLELREINLSRNSLSKLPDHMCEGVQNLHRVFLDDNHFTSVPAALYECSDIVFIGISYNDIREIPRGAISNVTSLQGLDISGNKNLGQYPPDVLSISDLRSLNVSNTAISSLPHPPCLSSERSFNYSLKCSEDHVELSIGSSKRTFYFQNLGAFYENWNIENCSDPEGMQFHLDCKTSTTEPAENESLTDSMVSVTTQSILHSDDDPSPVKNNKTVGGFILFISVVIFCIFSLFLKARERRSLHVYVTVGLWVILIALPIGTFVVTGVYFGILVALACLVLEFTVIAFLVFDLYFSCSSHETLSQNESSKLEVNLVDGTKVSQNAPDASKMPEERSNTESHS